MSRWCIYIDILGFSNLWEFDRPKAMASLRELMWAIIQVGQKVYPDHLSQKRERLFAHHIGDGFAIVSEFHEDSLERPISIAIALMRHVVASTGCFASAAIAEGDFADIQSCYPKEASRSQDRTINLGAGIMTLHSVMGTAFIRAYNISNKIKLSWPFLMIQNCNRDRFSSKLTVTDFLDDNNISSINWIESQTNLISTIQNKADLQNLSPFELTQKIQGYKQQYPDIVKKWKGPLCDYLNINTFGCAANTNIDSR